MPFRSHIDPPNLYKSHLTDNLRFGTANIMAITEIAQLRLLPPTTADDASLRSKLAHAKAVMEKYTGRNFLYLQQIEDPSIVYVIGEWDSLDQHMNGFIPAAENQALLESLKDELTVDWLLHLDVAQATLPLLKINTEADVISIGRHFIKSGEKDSFARAFESNKRFLQDYVTEGTIGGGWRVDKEDGKEEFVLFCPWKEMNQHFGFSKTEDFDKYAKIRDNVDGADINHAKLLVL